IFAGVTFHINGYTQPSHYELKLLLIDRGGKFLHYLSKTQVTHIIASSLTMAKEKELRNYKVVRPEWVVDSVRAGRQLSWHRYKLIGQGNTGVPTNPGQASLDLEAWGAMSLLSSTQNCTASSPAVGAAEPSDAQQQQQQQQPQPQPQVPPKTTVVVDRFGEGLNRSWVRKNIASDKDFIQRYYANSRLHHLSVWKADMKDYVAQLRQKYKQPTAKEKGSPESRIIMHVDFDCFFVSASLLLHPHLKDKPVAVCHSQQQQPQEEQPDSANSGSTGMSGRSGGSSQIASCNYIARSFGIRNGMFMGPARRLCPSLTTVPYHFDEYKRISQIFYEEVTKVADETQAVSIDEALLDVTEVVNREYQGNPELLAQHIRQLVQEKTRCTVSIGIGPSILLARVATTRAKPDGVYSLDTNRFMNMDMKVNDLPGAGHTIEDKLAAHGIRAVADVRSASLQQLQTICGEKMGTRLYNFSRGIDDRVLESDKPRQAFGADIGWGIRFSNQDEADGFVRRLTEEVCKSMSSAKRTGRSVTLKIKKRQEGQGRPEKFLGHGICDSLSRSTTLPQPTDDPARIASACIDLLRQMSINPLDIRSVGIQVQRL
ncbi:DNA/RNA polymerase, partial [Martensiomyces pterosporus]